MRTYQFLRAASPSQVAFNNLIVWTSPLWIPAFVVISVVNAGWDALTRPPEDPVICASLRRQGGMAVSPHYMAKYNCRSIK